MPLLGLHLDKERLIHSFKTALACSLGYALTKLINFPSDQWIVITILVVMCAQINVGSMLQKSYMRFLGTLLGSILAALVLAIFGKTTIAIALTIAFSGFVFSYIATGKTSYNDAGTLGAVTVAIILISQTTSLLTAGQRFIEITIGILIAALVSQIILPIHASANIRWTQAETLKKLKNYYQTSLISNTTQESIASYHDLDEEIVKSLSAQRTLAKESKRELFIHTFDIHRFEKILSCEKEIFRSIVCMRYACDMLPAGRQTLLQAPSIQEFHQHIEKLFTNFVILLETYNLDLTLHIPSTQDMKIFLNSLSTYNQEEKIYINGYVFCAELLVYQLQQLKNLLSLNHSNQMASKQNPQA